MISDLTAQAAAYLQRLCFDIDSRRVGSPGNGAATALFAEVMATHGWLVETQPFDCIDWRQDGAQLMAAGTSFAVQPSPYSLGCDVEGSLAMVSTVEELAAIDAGNSILLLRGEIASEQLMPKGFPFYNPEEHQRIIALLEAKAPLAIVAATSRDIQMVGGQYPFPLFEDGDFDIPSVYMTDEEGARLAFYVGQDVALTSRAARLPARGYNVLARKGTDVSRRIVIMSHIDARMGTPGANDNASGTITLLLLAQLMATYEGQPVIELVAMNGEDYYCSPGEQVYLAASEGRMGDISLGINLDDVAYHRGRTAYSLYGCSDETARRIRETFARTDTLVEGPPWFQGDHGLFLLHDVSALAVTDELLEELMANITHTTADTPEIVDPVKIVYLALALRDLLLRLAEH